MMLVCKAGINKNVFRHVYISILTVKLLITIIHTLGFFYFVKYTLQNEDSS